jgi:hypothetical protein
MNTTEPKKKLTMNAAEAATLAGVSEQYMLRLFRAGLVAATNHRGRKGWLTTEDNVADWVRRGMPAPPPIPEYGKEKSEEQPVRICECGHAEVDHDEAGVCSIEECVCVAFDEEGKDAAR